MHRLNGPLELVILTIGTDPDVTTELLNAVHGRNWSTNAFHFDRYFASSRRLSIGQDIASSGGCLAFVDFDRCPEEAAQTARYLAQTFPGKVFVIALGRRPSSAAILNAMRAGCSEYLSRQAMATTLDSIFDRYEETALAERGDVPNCGRVFAIIGAKGGVGATSVAVHLALYFAARHGKRTLLIDQQPRLGHACIHLGIDGENYSFHEVVRNLRRMDSELLHGFVAHHPSGLEVMSSPDTSADLASLASNDVSRTLDFLCGEYDSIVIDCDRAPTEVLPEILKSASEVYLVATPDVASIRDLSRIVDTLLIAEQPADKFKIVLNRYNSPHAISAEQIESALKLPVAVMLPDASGEVINAANTGRPIPHTASGEFAKTLTRWTDRMIGVPVKSATKRKEQTLLSRWRQTIPAW